MTEAPGRKTPVTMQDVAARAGVSIATVSRALTGTRPMSPALREHVVAAAELLGYQVNLIGRALRVRRTSSLGLIVPDLENPFFSALAQQVSRSFATSDTDVYIYSADNSLDLERRGIQSFLGRQVDGLVLIPCHEVDSRDNVLLASGGVVTVQFDRWVPSAPTRYVGCDNRAGMRLVAEHLLCDVDLARQPPMFVGAGPTSSTAHERLNAFTTSMPGRRVLLGDFSFGWGQLAADQLLDDGLTSGTIVAAADVIALGVMAAVQAHGLRVPDDIRVIGFDDLGVSSLAHPTLTSIRQPVAQMTEAIVDIILGRISGQNLATEDLKQTFAPALVVRQSSPSCC